MTETEWLVCNDPTPMLEFLKGRVNDRKLRLFAVACCRRVLHLLSDERWRKAVEVAEQYAVGTASETELRLANRSIEFDPATLDSVAFLASVHRFDRPSVLFRYGIVDMTRLDEAANKRLERICWSGCHFPAEVAVVIAGKAVPGDTPTEATIQAAFLRCLCGNPFRSITFAPSCFVWNDAAIPKLAQAIYDDRAFDRLPILADALEEAGCHDADILNHLRSQGPHVRGCWALDVILGKT